MPWARGSLMSSTRLMMRAAEALPIPDGWYAPGFDDSSWPGSYGCTAM
jgi:hypothetical protein